MPPDTMSSGMEALLEGVNQERYQAHQAAQQGQPSAAEPSMMAMAMAYPPPQQHGLRIAPPRPPETPLNRCWGAELKGGDASTCQPGFQCGKVHFKNKFCSCCRAGIDVPASRIRPLSPELQIAFANSQSEGFWKTGPSHLGGGMLRIINNTAACVGPWLAIYRSEPPALQWGEIPAKWVMDGYVRLCVAKGTLVPDLELRGKSLMRKRDGVAPLPYPAKCVRLEDHSGLLAHVASVAAPVMAVAAQQPLAIENSDGSSTTVEADKAAMPYASAYAAENGVPMAKPAYANGNGAYADANGTVTNGTAQPPGTRLATHEPHSPPVSCAVAMARPASNQPQYSPHHSFTHEFVRAHSGLAALVEARLSAPVEMPASEREMLSAHLKLSSAVLRAVSGTPPHLPEEAHDGLAGLANVCVGLLEG